MFNRGDIIHNGHSSNKTFRIVDYTFKSTQHCVYLSTSAECTRCIRYVLECIDDETGSRTELCHGFLTRIDTGYYVTKRYKSIKITVCTRSFR